MTALMHCCQKFSLNQLVGIAAGLYCIWLVLQLAGIEAGCKMSRSAGNRTISVPLPSFAEFFCRLGKGGIETLRCVQGGLRLQLKILYDMGERECYSDMVIEHRRLGQLLNRERD